MNPITPVTSDVKRVCTRTIFFGLFYAVLLEKCVDTIFKKELQLSMSMEQSNSAALVSRHISGPSEQSQQVGEAEPCCQRGFSGEPDPAGCWWWWWPCLPTLQKPHRGAGKVSAGTPRTPAAPAASGEEDQGKPPAASWLPSSSTLVMMVQSP